MSQVYNLEPQPTAKCILHTSTGDLELELFAAQTPLASRSFLQHCLNGYYNGTFFHRLVPGFILQGGDPTGTGSGGVSALDNNAPFADEFHSRLKFNRRGLVGMANGGTRDDNGSQFFFTLGKAEELTGRHTLFGRVVGDTIYNLVKMGEGEVGEGERPIYPTRITGATVVVNPFEGMVAQVRVVQDTAEKPAVKQKKKTKKGGKQLLSFDVGDEGEEGDAGESMAAKTKKSKVNPRFVDVDAGSAGGKAQTETETLKEGHDEPIPKQKETKVTKQPFRAPLPPAPRRSTKSPSSENSNDDESDEEDEEHNSTAAKSQAALSKADEEIEALKSSLRRAVVEAPQSHPKQKKSALEAFIPETATRGRKRKAPGASSTSIISAEEQRVVDQFRAFQDRIKAASQLKAHESRSTKAVASASSNGHGAGKQAEKQAAASKTGMDEEEEEAVCDLHFVPNCQSCKKWDEEQEAASDDDDNGLDWMSHRLTFAKDRLGKDLEWKKQNAQIMETSMFDPKAREKELKTERRRVKR